MLLSGVRARFAALPYGNFCDVAKTFGCRTIEGIMRARKTEKVWPLEVIVDGEHYRYGVGYFTMGMFAEASREFDDIKRKKI